MTTLWRTTARAASARLLAACGDGDGDGAIVRSTDRGQSWRPVPGTPAARTLNDVRFLDATLGHAVGQDGVQLASRDGGLSWSARLTGTQMNLQAVFFLDEQTGWIAGSEGSILATATGGR